MRPAGALTCAAVAEELKGKLGIEPTARAEELLGAMRAEPANPPRPARRESSPGAVTLQDRTLGGLSAPILARHSMNRLSASRRGYDHRWRIRSKHFLQRNPLCVMCEAEGKLTVASVVDHIVPHKGDPVLFNDVRNWQPLCKAHHDRTKQRIDTHGYSTEVDPATGLYRDPKHPSNAR